MAEEKDGFSKFGKLFAKRHNLAIMKVLLASQRGVGFNTIMRGLAPITPRILSARLKELEQLKLVQKNLVLGSKPKIEYMATVKAEGLRGVIEKIEQWGKEF